MKYNKALNQFKKTLFWNSLKNFNKRYIFTALFDASFLLVLYLLLQLAYAVVLSVDFSPFKILQENPTSPGIVSQVYNIILGLSFNVLIFFILVIIAWSVLRVLIYRQIFKKKFPFSIHWKFTLFNLSAFILFLLFLILVQKFIQEEYLGYFVLISLFLFSYFMNLFYIMYFKNPKIFGALRNSWKLFGKRTWFAISVVFGYVIVFLVLIKLTSLIGGAFINILFLLLLLSIPVFFIYLNEKQFPSPIFSLFGGFVLIIILLSLVNMVLTPLNFTDNRVTSNIISFTILGLLYLGLAWLRFYTVSTVNKIEKK